MTFVRFLGIEWPKDAEALLQVSVLDSPAELCTEPSANSLMGHVFPKRCLLGCEGSGP